MDVGIIFFFVVPCYYDFFCYQSQTTTCKHLDLILNL